MVFVFVFVVVLWVGGVYDDGGDFVLGFVELVDEGYVVVVVVGVGMVFEVDFEYWVIGCCVGV